MSQPDIDFLEQEAPDEVAVPEIQAEPATPEAATVETPETPAPEVPTTPEPAEDRVPMAALIAERKKRQEYEAKLRELQQPRPEPPKFQEAPEQYVQHIAHQMQQQLVTALEAQARETYPDYDDVFAEFEEQAQGNPALVQQVLQAPNPAVAAYKLGKQLRELKQMQDPDAYRKQVEAEVRAKIEAEFRAKEEAKAKATNAIPPDLTAARASRDDEVVPDDSLESILQSKRR